MVEILENLGVGKLVMHRPWEHAAEIKSEFAGQPTTKRLTQKLKAALDKAHEVEKLATQKQIKIVEPFSGIHGSFFDGTYNLTILGPSREYYQSLVPHFSRTPDPLSELLGFTSGVKPSSEPKWHFETEQFGVLDEGEDTQPQNNASTVLLLEIPGQKCLFTGDAGQEALWKALAYAQSIGKSLDDLTFLQVPHHGSRRNLSPSLLKAIKAGTAFVSTAAEHTPKHPCVMVLNELQRSGSNVFCTNGKGLCHYQGSFQRSGWGPATCHSFVPVFLA